MRIIAGTFRSRRLKSLPGTGIRPTSDRLRETLFNVLSPGTATLNQKVFFDLYAGTGAVGIEALSRGAAKVYFIESSKQASDLILENLHSLEIPPSSFDVLRSEVAPALRRLQGSSIPADIVFMDPPYRMESAYSETLEALASSQLLRPGAVVIAEHLKKFEPPSQTGVLKQFRTLKQGDAALTFWRPLEITPGK
jgi:16S rRNA (guanine(966)-N(2))-methyltransferase RsmD